MPTVRPRPFPSDPLIFWEFKPPASPVPALLSGERVKAFSKYPNAYVKCSGTHWLPETAKHAGEATLDLLSTYGKDRLLFGT